MSELPRLTDDRLERLIAILQSPAVAVLPIGEPCRWEIESMARELLWKRRATALKTA